VRIVFKIPFVCLAYAQARDESNGRFAVADDRSADAIEAEAAVQQHLQKAIKAAAAKRKAAKEKSKAKEAAAHATAAEEEDEEEEDDDDGDGDADSDNGGQLTPRGAALAEDSFYAEAEAAFAAHAARRGPKAALALPPSALQEALVQVCNRFVSRSEAAALLRGLEARTPADPHALSFDDFLNLCRAAVAAGVAAATAATAAEAAGAAAAEAAARAQQEETAQSAPAEPLALLEGKPVTFWDTHAGRRALQAGSAAQPPRPPVPEASAAAGGGVSAVRKIARKLPRGSSASAEANSPEVGAPEAAAATFAVSPAVLDLGSCAAGAVATGTLALTNVSPFAARFRTRPGAPGATVAVAATHKGPVASGATVTLTVELQAGAEGGLVEGTLVVVSEHQ
jgi:hypothetical protein